MVKEDLNMGNVTLGIKVDSLDDAAVTVHFHKFIFKCCLLSCPSLLPLTLFSAFD